jgi:hypothetical protein
MLHALQRRGALPLLVACLSATSCKPKHEADVLRTAPPPRVVEYPASSGVRLGQGWSDESDSKTQSVCISFQPASWAGQSKSVDFQEVIDRSSLLSALDVSLAIQVHALFASVDASTSYADKVSTSSENTNIVAHARVWNGVTFAAPVSAAELNADQTKAAVGALRPGADSLRPEVVVSQITGAGGAKVDLLPEYAKMAQHSPAQFLRTCGDRFVSAVLAGGQLAAMFEFQNTSDSEAQALQVEVKGGGWGVSVDGKLAKTLQTYQNNSRLNMTFFETGGNGNPTPTTQVQLFDEIRNLPTIVKNAPFPYEVTLESYQSLPSWPTAQSSAQDIDKILQLARVGNELLSLHDEMQAILQEVSSDPGKYIFWGTTPTLLKAKSDEVQIALDTLRSVAQRCANADASACRLPRGISASDYQYRIYMPVRRGSFDYDTTLRALAWAADSADKNAGAAAVAAPPMPPGAFGLPVAQAFPIWIRLRTAPHTANRDGLMYEFLAQRQAWGERLRDHIIDEWVRRASDLRCDLQPPDDGCLFNSTIDSLAAMVPIGSPRGVGATDSGLGVKSLAALDAARQGRFGTGPVCNPWYPDCPGNGVYTCASMPWLPNCAAIPMSAHGIRALQEIGKNKVLVNGLTGMPIAQGFLQLIKEANAQPAIDGQPPVLFSLGSPTPVNFFTTADRLDTQLYEIGWPSIRAPVEREIRFLEASNQLDSGEAYFFLRLLATLPNE